jgi:phosphohistidine phosphatase
LHKKEEDIILISDLYHAPADIFYEVVKGINNQFNTAAIFGHNPGISYFVNSLVEKVNINDMPTCGVFAVTANIESWKEFAAAEKELLFFDYPKNG